MFKKDTKTIVIGEDGMGREVPLGELAEKYAESLRAGTEEYLVDIAVWDHKENRMYPAKARVRVEERKVPIVGIKANLPGSSVLYCSRDTRVFTSGGPANQDYPAFGPIPAEKLDIGYIGRQAADRNSRNVTVGAKVTEIQVNTADYEVVSVRIMDENASRVFFAGRLAVMEPSTV